MGAVKAKNLLKLLPVLVGGVVSFFLWPQLPLQANQTGTLSVYDAKVVTHDGFAHIQVMTSHKEQRITSDNANHTQPAVADEYVVWLVAEDTNTAVVRFHAPTQTYLKVTQWGNNQNPVVDATGRVAWQTWRDERWQIQWFDGQSVQVMHSETNDIEPVWYKGSIYFSRKSSVGEWQVGMVNIETGEGGAAPQAPPEVITATKVGRVARADRSQNTGLPVGSVTNVAATPIPNPPQEVISNKPQKAPDVQSEEAADPIHQSSLDLTDQNLTEGQ